MPGHVRARGKRADGTTKWQARWRHPEDPGERREKQFRRKDDAKRWLVEMESAVYSGSYIDPRTRQTFGEVVAEWRESKRLDHGPKMKAGVASVLKAHVLPRWEKKPVAVIAADQLQVWVNDELAPTRSAKTVSNIFGVMRSVMAFAVVRRYRADNPCVAVTLPSRRRHTGGRPRRKSDHIYLSPAELRTLADALDPHWRVPVLATGQTGLRAGEVWALRRRDINTVDGRLSVELSLKQIASSSEDLAEHEKGLVFSEPKSEAAARSFTLPDVTNRLLRAYLEAPGTRSKQGYAVVRRQQDGSHRLAYTDDANDPDRLVFTTPNGLPVRHDMFYRRVFKVAVAGRLERRFRRHGREFVTPAIEAALPQHADYANRRGLTFHDLRHTCASLTLSVSGGNFYIVKERLGHEDIQTTVNTYGHLVPHADAAIANSLSELFEAEPSKADNVVELASV